MKQLKHRTIFVLIFALLLSLGILLFCVLYGVNGRKWASSPVNQAAYSGGRLSSGMIYDRDGTLLYDCANQSYGDSALLRTSTLHLIGDLQGNIATGARKLFADKLVSYNLITGLSSTGNNLYLSVDADVNETAYQALKGRSGTVAVYNYKTGEILCMVSTPAYDPADSDEVEAVASGDSDYDGAYMNRFLSSTFTPGSTFKVITAAAAIEHLDVANFSFHCTGSMELGGGKITCTSAHGDLDFAGALAHSCNCAFATLAEQLGGATLQSYVEGAGLLSGVNINGYTTASGSFDVAENGSLELGWSGCGQYNDLVNPAAMLTLMGCIAGDGKAATPRLLSKVTSQSGLPAGIISTDTSTIDWQSSTCQQLQQMMRNDVLTTYGQEQFGDLAVCAKSGTAEVGSSAAPHAWFVGFVDDDAHPYAFVSVIQNGGGGASQAGAVAATVLNAVVAAEDNG